MKSKISAAEWAREWTGLVSVRCLIGLRVSPSPAPCQLHMEREVRVNCQCGQGAMKGWESGMGT